jgi:hypothetical protein
MGAWTEIADYTVPSNTTSVVLNDFGTITKDDFIKVVTTIINPAGSNIFLTANSTVNANYDGQVLVGSASSVFAFRVDAPQINRTPNAGSSHSVTYLKISENDRVNYFSNFENDIGSNVEIQMTYVTSSGATFTSGITSLTFTGNQNINTGSRIQIYRLDAEKVRDITVTSNSTQVDIPVTGSLDPAITKDSEYLLVSYFPTDAESDYFLTPNDLTTQTGYYAQQILGFGSDAFAGRANTARFARTDTTRTRSLSYTFIKLSEIGAFTFQSYLLQGIASTTLALANNFTSSTAENITSITKLNVIASASNQIKSGSRFELYKLK